MSGLDRELSTVHASCTCQLEDLAEDRGPRTEDKCGQSPQGLGLGRHRELGPGRAERLDLGAA